MRSPISSELIVMDLLRRSTSARLGSRRKPRRTGFRPGVESIEPRFLLSASSADVLTYHNDNARTGQDLDETILTPANVNSSDFGKLFTDPVDGYVYTQPLYMANVTIPGQGVHNVVFVATANDSVYAFDADNPGPPLWHDSLTDPAAGITAIPTTQIWQDDIGPEEGITGTPVIDPTTGTLYVVAKTQQTTAKTTVDELTLYALNVSTGAERSGGPVVVHATVAGHGAGQSRGNVSFQAEWEIERPGLLLDNGVVYTAFGSLGDHGPYHGWVIGYNASTLAEVAVFNDTPNSRDPYGNEGGIWMDGGGLAADSSGNIYLLTGSGQFDPAQGSYADAALKLTPSLKLTDYFAPQGTGRLDKLDLDLGSGGVLLAPTQPGSAPNLLIGGGKSGILYAIDTDDMGHQRAKNPHVQQVALAGDGIFSSAAYWNGMVYVQAVNDVLRQYRLVNGQLVGPIEESSTVYPYPGATPSISANGSSEGIVWEVEHTGTRAEPGPAVLYAYNAANVSQVLYNSAMAGTRDQAGPAVKFAVPTIANAKVYVGTQTGMTVYGLRR
jgi:hypothetical protein